MAGTKEAASMWHMRGQEKGGQVECCFTIKDNRNSDIKDKDLIIMYRTEYILDVCLWCYILRL